MTDCDRAQRWSMFTSHSVMVRAYIRRFARDAEEARDLFQEVSLTIWRHPTGPRDMSKFAPWCRGLVRNAALEQRRKRGKHHVLLELDSDDESNGHEQLLGWDEDIENVIGFRQLLGRCLHKTSKATQLLLVRRYVFEESAADIGSELGNSAVAVRMKLKRVRNSLMSAAARAERSGPRSSPGPD